MLLSVVLPVSHKVSGYSIFTSNFLRMKINGCIIIYVNPAGTIMAQGNRQKAQDTRQAKQKTIGDAIILLVVVFIFFSWI